MEQNALDTEALAMLIKSVNNYKDSLNTNRQILINAANVCNATMGNDEISKAHIKRLKKALEKLEKTAELAGEVATLLMIEKQTAEEEVRKASERV